MPQNPIDEDLRRQVKELVDQYRDRCPWCLRAGYYPTNRHDLLQKFQILVPSTTGSAGEH